MHALAKHVTSEAECRRLFGSNWNQKLVDGEVVDVSRELTAAGRLNYFIQAKYTIQGRTKTKKLNIRSVRKGHQQPPSATDAPSPPTVPTANATTTGDNTTTTTNVQTVATIPTPPQVQVVNQNEINVNMNIENTTTTMIPAVETVEEHNNIDADGGTNSDSETDTDDGSFVARAHDYCWVKENTTNGLRAKKTVAF